MAHLAAMYKDYHEENYAFEVVHLVDAAQILTQRVQHLLETLVNVRFLRTVFPLFGLT